MLGRARALVICVVLRASAFVIRRPARAPMAAFSSSATDLTRPTIKDYDDVAEDFWEEVGTDRGGVPFMRDRARGASPARADDASKFEPTERVTPK